MGQADQLETIYRNALATASGDARAWSMLASLLGSDPSRLDEAEVAYRRAIELDPDQAVFTRLHGEARLVDVNPEVRAAAKRIYDWLDAPRRRS